MALNNQRVIGLDAFKGWAIVFMLLYHISYDLNYFSYIEIDMHRDSFWIYSRYLIVSMFLLAVGMSLSLGHHTKIQWHKVYRRILFLGGASLLITISTSIIFPQTWVYFGILHFILLASVMGLVFIPYPFLSFSVAFIILLGHILGWLHLHWLFFFIKRTSFSTSIYRRLSRSSPLVCCCTYRDWYWQQGLYSHSIPK
ncbi:MAG: heparan-alpha-glucosaminide N-acetyltransferase domain-containing protein [Sulfurovum sp.]|nr:heparan-alpha-glucosaminide N-acetyltransferase domain-containing protein [Sulfurovum sp.]